MPYLFFTLFISVIVAVFAVQNAVSVSLNFAVWTMQTNLVIVILEMAALQKDNAKLREEVAMLMHTQKLHKEAAAKAEPAVTAADE